jgi:hypothetical protein
MGRRWVVPLVLLPCLGVGGVASAAEEPPTSVRAALCHRDGGLATVPAGSEIVIQLFFFAQNEVQYAKWLDVREISATVDGVAVSDAESYWSDPTPAGTGQGLVSEWSYPTGVSLHGRQSLDFTLIDTVSERFGPMNPDDPFVIDCHVTVA